ncbi:MAG: M6 family metalloprotease domain-containing protein [Bacteroidales bacterium]|nr:M6 family metalloprotease domain-containing protein [Bacteroidales bacterium]
MRETKRSMKHHIKFWILAMVLTLTASSALAVPGCPDMVVFHQPNSEITVNIYLKGDERVHWAESEDGYTLVHSDDGSLVYATTDGMGNLMPTTFVATDITQRPLEVEVFLKKTPRHLRYSQKQVDDMLEIWRMVEDSKQGPKAMTDVTGSKKFLVILFGFNDKHFTFGKNAFRFLFNQENYSDFSAIGSVHDYYLDVSQGQFSLSVDVVGPFVGTEDMAYYGNTNEGSQAFAREAVDSAAKYVNFSHYDNDGDGYIDGLHIIFAGYGEEAGAPASAIWSHKWNIFDAPTYNNTVVDVYSCSPELTGNTGTVITHIGVICHELGHVFGSPDYYDTDYASSGGEYPGLGQWDIMSSGSWNRGGICPAQHNPYTKLYIYHWATCDTLDNSPKMLAMEPSERSMSEFHRINTMTNGDFFLIENRQKIKWDAHIPGNGLLVYHVHPNAHGRSVNNSRHPQQLYLMSSTAANYQAPTSDPSSYGNVNSDQTPYPGFNNRNDSLTDNCSPWFRPWSGQRNYMSFYHIAQNSSNQKLYLCIGNAEPDPINPSAEGVSVSQISLDWTPYGNYSTLILMSDDTIFGIPDTLYNVGDTLPGGGVVVYNGNGDHTMIDSLARGQLCNFKFFSQWDGSYSAGVTGWARTLLCDGTAWDSEDFETSTGRLPECWTGDWRIVTLSDSNHVLASNYQYVSDPWVCVTTEPFSYDTVRNTVLHLRYSMMDCNADNMFKIEYRADPTVGWREVYSDTWRFGMAEWQDVYVPLTGAGNYSRLRFSANTVASGAVLIDDISLVEGNLIFADADENGSISPEGYQVFAQDEEVTFTITPLSGYKLKRLTVDGNKVTPTATETGAKYTLTVTGNHTLYATFEVKVGIEEGDATVLKLYPNPTTGVVTVECLGHETVTLYNMKGQTVMQVNATGQTLTLDLSTLPHGVYMLRSSKGVAKIVKNK